MTPSRARLGWLLLALLAVGVVAWLLAGPEAPVPSPGPEPEPASPDAGPAAPSLATGPAAADVPAPRDDPPAPAGSARIDVEVVDTGGRPLVGVPVALEATRRAFVHRYEAGASAVLLSDPPDRAREPLARLHTNAEGRVSFERLDPTRAFLVAARPAAPFAPTSVRVRASARAGAWVRLVLPRGTALPIRVVDVAGRGVPATVQLELATADRPGEQGWRSDLVRTDGDGRAHLAAVPPGIHRAHVVAAGFAERSGIVVRVPAAGEIVVRLGMQDGATLEGRVLDAAGDAVVGATVLARCGGHAYESRPTLVRMIRTGADGAYRLEGLPPGPLVGVECVADGFVVPRSVAARRHLEAGVVTTLDFQLQRGCFVHGRVVDEGGEPVPGAYVETSVSPEFGRGGTAYQLKVEAAPDGRYALGPLPLGRGVATPKAAGFHVAGDTPLGGPRGPPGFAFEFVAAGERRAVDLVMTRGVLVQGRVVDAGGRPVAGAAVRLIGPKTLWRAYSARERVASDAAGVFRFPGLPPIDAFTVEVTSGDQRARGTIRPGAVTDVVLAPTASLTGRVIWPGPPPGDRWHVRVEPEGERRRRVRVEGADGAFTVRGLPPGRTTLEVRDAFGRATGSMREVVLAAGETADGIELRPGALGVIGGAVVDGEGRALAGHLVTIAAPEDGGRTARTYTDGAGRFRVGLLPEGSYRVVAEHGDVPAEVPTGALNVRLAVTHRPVHFRGTVLLPDGTPLPRGTVNVLLSREAGRTAWYGVSILMGRFEYELAPGTERVVVRLTDAVDAMGQRVSIEPFEATLPAADPATIRLVAARAIDGLVVDEQGRGVAGVRVSGWVTPTDGRPPTIAHAVSSAEGRFRLVGFAASAVVGVRVQDVPAGYSMPAPIDVGPKASTLRITLAGRGGRVTGRVLDEAGRALGGVPVVGTFGSTQLFATTGPDGRFALDGVPAGARGSLRAVPQADRQPFQPATVQGIAAGQRDVEIHLPAGRRLAGTVVGEEVGDVQVAFYVGGRRITVVRTQADGTFTLSLADDAEGTLSVVDTRGNRFARLEDVAPPRDDLRLELQPGRTITGRVRGVREGERWIVQAAGRACHVPAIVDRDGSFRIPGLVPGAYDLLAFAVGARQQTRVVREGVSAGERDVTLDVPGR